MPTKRCVHAHHDKVNSDTDLLGSALSMRYMRWLLCYSIRHAFVAALLLALVCGAIAPNVDLLEPGMMHDEHPGQ